MPDFHHKPCAHLFQHTGQGQNLQYAAKQPPVLRHNVQFLPQGIRLYRFAHLAFPPQLIEGRERIGPRQALQVHIRGGPFFRFDTLCRKECGVRRGTGRYGCRTRKEIRGQHCGRKEFVAPDDFVQQVLQALRRGKQGCAGGALHRVSAQTAKLYAVRRIELQIAAQHFPCLVPPLVPL